MSVEQPQVMISHSDDGGMTFSHEQWFNLVGADKNYLNRIILRRQGSSYNRIYRIKCSDDTPITMVSAHADLTIGI
jgi:hypothetical protein